MSKESEKKQNERPQKKSSERRLLPPILRIGSRSRYNNRSEQLGDIAWKAAAIINPKKRQDFLMKKFLGELIITPRLAEAA